MDRRKVLWTLFAFVLLLAHWAPPISAAMPAAKRIALIALHSSANGDAWYHDEGLKTPPRAADEE